MAYYLTIWGVVSLTAAILGGIVAKAKRRDADKWAFACFFLPFLFFALIALPKYQGTLRKKRISEEQEDLQEYLRD